MAYSVLLVNVFELQNSGVDNTYEKERVAQAKRIMKPFVLRRLKKDVSECLMIITLKVTVHLEQCFQFSVCNVVNTHQTPTTYILMEKVMKLSK